MGRIPPTIEERDKYRVIHPSLEEARKFLQDKREFCVSYKKGATCAMCGTTENLTFHHRNKDTKVNTISNMMGTWTYYSMEDVKQELNKCDILCRSCHNLIDGID